MALSVTLALTAYIPQQLLRNSKPKIVFAGRSNVGKSSLLNALCGQNLAKISSKPGKTQSVNYYQVTGHDFYLVDLPGYGYAEASKDQRDSWRALLDAFFGNEENLICVCVLLDARLPPQDKDLQMIRYAQERDYRVRGIMTKADKCSKSMLAERMQTWITILKNPPIVTSAKNKQGIGDVRSMLLNLVGEKAQ
ncbi:MAG: YihA family ribosome biogenesis GTP-binding protein [Desulfovibrio sp.]|nr:YihA family ribosome biogenesis GTP-binding protein [Desulfovibrio sp.]